MSEDSDEEHVPGEAGEAGEENDENEDEGGDDAVDDMEAEEEAATGTSGSSSNDNKVARTYADDEMFGDVSFAELQKMAFNTGKRKVDRKNSNYQCNALVEPEAFLAVENRYRKRRDCPGLCNKRGRFNKSTNKVLCVTHGGVTSNGGKVTSGPACAWHEGCKLKDGGPERGGHFVGYPFCREHYKQVCELEEARGTARGEGGWTQFKEYHRIAMNPAYKKLRTAARAAKK